MESGVAHIAVGTNRTLCGEVVMFSTPHNGKNLKVTPCGECSHRSRKQKLKKGKEK